MLKEFVESTIPLEDSEPEIISSKDILKKNKNKQKDEDEEALNQAFIKKLQEEEEKAYKEEMERRKKFLEDNEAKMICNICLDDLFNQEVHTLDACDHVFHMDCIKGYVVNEIKSKKGGGLICPDGQCKAEINIEELRDVLTNKQIEDFYSMSLETYVDNHGADVKIVYIYLR